LGAWGGKGGEGEIYLLGKSVVLLSQQVSISLRVTEHFTQNEEEMRKI
jgi:hypothetical protein